MNTVIVIYFLGGIISYGFLLGFNQECSTEEKDSNISSYIIAFLLSWLFIGAMVGGFFGMIEKKLKK